MNENSDDYFKYVGLVNLEFNKELSSSKLSEIKEILLDKKYGAPSYETNVTIKIK